MAEIRASVFLTQTPYTPQIWGGDGLVRRFRAQYEAGSRKHFALVESPRDADLIIYCEDYQESEQSFAPKLRSERLVAEFPERVFVVCNDDAPLGFLSGVYASMPSRRFDSRRFRAGAYFGEINPQIATAECERTIAPRLLFSFVGARTADVRAELFGKFATTKQWWIEETGVAQYNVCVDEPAKKDGQLAYLRTLLDSHFVLCPRGLGTSSFRLFETMRLGRVPVILSDDWVPPLGPAWPECSIRVAEHKIEHLPEILASRLSDAPSLANRARLEWENWFSPAVLAGRCLEWIHDIQLARSHIEADCFARWPELIASAKRDRPYVRELARKAKRRLKAAAKILASSS